MARTGCGNLSHSKAAPLAQRSSWSLSPPGSGCTQSAQDAKFCPWQSPPGVGRSGCALKERALKGTGSGEKTAGLHAETKADVDLKTMNTGTKFCSQLC